MTRPVPTVLAKLHGNPGKRPLPKHIPRPAAALWEPPDWLSPAQKALWGDLVATSPPGLLTESHRNLMVGLVSAIALHQQALEAIEREGAMTITPNGYKVPSPWLAVVNKQIVIMQRLSAELGLTPTSGTRVSLTPDPPIREPGTYDLATQTLDEFLATPPSLPSMHLPQPTKCRKPKMN